MKHRYLSASALRISAILLAATSAGCVSKTRYEEARSAISVEQEARRRTQSEVLVLDQKLGVLQGQLAEREQRLEAADEQIAESNLARDMALGERQSATELVDQLRADLERTGNHLRQFAEEKNRIAVELDQAEVRAKRVDACEQNASDNAAIVRDAALVMKDPIAVGEIELDPVDGRVVLRIPAGEIEGETLTPTADHLMSGVARVASLHMPARISIAETGGNPNAKDASPRLRTVADRLSALGVAPERVETRKNAASSAGGPPSIEISIYIDASAPAPSPAEPQSESESS